MSSRHHRRKAFFDKDPLNRINKIYSRKHQAVSDDFLQYIIELYEIRLRLFDFFNRVVLFNIFQGYIII